MVSAEGGSGLRRASFVGALQRGVGRGSCLLESKGESGIPLSPITVTRGVVIVPRRSFATSVPTDSGARGMPVPTVWR